MIPHGSASDARWPRDGGHHLVVGGAASGKTTALVAAFVDFVRTNGPTRAVFLVPTRQRAATLQNVIAHAFGGTTGQLLVRTPASLAFGLLRQGAVSAGQPSPTLITGPEQDHVLAELIAGHLADGAGPAWPPEVTPEVVSMRAFRHELRDLLMRAAEAGLDGAGLSELGQEHSRPEWVAAGQILDEYTAVMLLGETTPDRGARYDAATILDRAVALLRERPDLAAFDAVVHDDYQDATLATSRLLGTLAGHGAQLLLASNPDTAVQGFRGGLPSLSHTATLPLESQDGAFAASVHVLETTSIAAGVWSKISRIADELPPLVGAARRKALPVEGPSPLEPAVQTVALSSAAGEGAYIARRLRELHLRDGHGWGDLAVIVRGHQQLVRIRRALTAAGIPIKVSGAEVPLRDEPVVKALLACIEIASTPLGPTAAQVSELLMSTFGGIDALALRRLRRTLRHIDPSRTSAELLVDAMENEDLRVASGNHPGLHRIARMLDVGTQAVRESLGVHMVLWRIWEAAGVAESWQTLALGGGARGVRADSDLDAALALFTVAEQFVDRRAGAHPRALIEYLREQDFPADTLADRAARTDAVELHTAASAAGQHWPIVFVAGVQEDAWPDLRLRDSLLGSAALAQIATDRSGGEPLTPAQARREVLHDERRMFLAACSRARLGLIVTAVLDADARPSAFFDALTDGPIEVQSPLPPLDMRGLIGTLRAHAGDSAEPGPRRAAATSLLTELSSRGVTEADATIWSPAWSGQGGVHEMDKVVLRPSEIEQALTCPLKWFLTEHGGRAAQTRAQTLGNLIHDIARKHPKGTYAELLAELDARFGELELPDNHIAQATREQAEGMIRQLSEYIGMRDVPVLTEVSFEADLGNAVIKGQVDRVEFRENGPHIVDFKTGSRRLPADVARRHPQLGAYQLAVAHGAFASAHPSGDSGATTVTPGETAGASLVFLAVNKSVLVRDQVPLQEDEERWAEDMIAEAVRVVTADEFPARPSPECDFCPVRSACPAMPDGVRLGEED